VQSEIAMLKQKLSDSEGHMLKTKNEHELQLIELNQLQRQWENKWKESTKQCEVRS
jgi:hypothetical protein